MWSLRSLQFVYANSNRISEVPELLSALPLLKVRALAQLDSALSLLLLLQELNLANNLLEVVPRSWTERWGHPHPSSGVLTLEPAATDDKSKATIVSVLSNPLIV